MSHAQPITSPEGTPLLEQTVGEIVAANPNLSRVFQSFEIGFCCQGKLTLADACRRNGVDPDALVAAIQAELAGREPPRENPARLPLPELADYIVEHHHGYLQRELPRIHAMAERVAHVHGGHTPSLVEVYQVFSGMAQELALHTRKEETVLFPAIREINSGSAEGRPLEDPVHFMMIEHDSTMSAMARLRDLTDGFSPPSDACNTYRALFAGLAELEADTRQHIHLENNVLFPGALKQMAQ
jgi:regulator of cell morphogenesis and NO signaling